MEDINILKSENEVYKRNLENALRHSQDLEFELKLVREERDKAIGEKYLALAKLKEQAEDVASLQARFQAMETSSITMKIEHVNLKSNYESLKDDNDISKKLLQIRDNEIRNLIQAQDPKRRPQPQTPTKLKESIRPPINKNLKPFPSASFSFNIIPSHRLSNNGSLREDTH